MERHRRMERYAESSNENSANDASDFQKILGDLPEFDEVVATNLKNKALEKIDENTNFDPTEHHYWNEMQNGDNRFRRTDRRKVIDAIEKLREEDISKVRMLAEKGSASERVVAETVLNEYVNRKPKEENSTEKTPENSSEYLDKLNNYIDDSETLPPFSVADEPKDEPERQSFPQFSVADEPKTEPEKKKFSTFSVGEAPKTPEETSEPNSKEVISESTEIAPEPKEIIKKPEASEETIIAYEKLKKLRPELAELYARNRRLVIGTKNIENYEEARLDYEFALKEYIASALKDNKENAEKIDPNTLFLHLFEEEQNSLVDETMEKLKNGSKVRKFINKAMNNKIVQNKWFKRAVFVAGAAGAAITGASLANGSLVFEPGVNSAVGAAIGGVVGGLTSRQNPEKSNLTRINFANDAKTIDEKAERLNSDPASRDKYLEIANMDVESDPKSVDKVIEWITEEYDRNNRADQKANYKRTMIGTMIGMVSGFISGSLKLRPKETIEIPSQKEPTFEIENEPYNPNLRRTETNQIPVDAEIPEVENLSVDLSGNVSTTHNTFTPPAENIAAETAPVYDVDLSKIDIRPGSGMKETFTDLGGSPENFAEAKSIAYELTKDSKYANKLVPGSSGSNVSKVPGWRGKKGSYAFTYKGTLDKWPQLVQDFTKDLAQKWAEAGLIPHN